jgi:hypothetical protein
MGSSRGPSGGLASSRCDVQHYGAVQFLTGFTILYFYPAVPCWAASDENMAAWWCLPPTLITVGTRVEYSEYRSASSSKSEAGSLCWPPSDEGMAACAAISSTAKMGLH